MEAGGVCNLARVYAARQVRYAIGYLIPGAMEFLGGCLRRRLYTMSFLYERREIDHPDVVVEGINDMLAGYIRREGRDGCEDGAFRHCAGRWADSKAYSDEVEESEQE